jgi:hypothetical protein
LFVAQAAKHYHRGVITFRCRRDDSICWVKMLSSARKDVPKTSKAMRNAPAISAHRVQRPTTSKIPTAGSQNGIADANARTLQSGRDVWANLRDDSVHKMCQVAPAHEGVEQKIESHRQAQQRISKAWHQNPKCPYPTMERRLLCGSGWRHFLRCSGRRHDSRLRNRFCRPFVYRDCRAPA